MILLAIGLCLSQAQAGTIDFFALGKPSMLKIHGTSVKVTNSAKIVSQTISGKFELPLETLETGMATRDSHMREKVLETKTYPSASLMLDSLKISSDKMSEVPFKGKLTLHGVEKEITGTADLEKSGKIVKILARLEVKLTDFKMTPPDFLGMKVQDTVKIEVREELALAP